MAATGADAAGSVRRRLYVYNGGFLMQRRVRRILALAGHEIRIGRPGPGDMVGVWGRSPTSPRGDRIAERTGAPVLRVEDAFLRSIRTGRSGEPPRGLILDPIGVHFDASGPSLLEHLAVTDPLDDTALLNRARDGIARLKALELSKYNAFNPSLAVPEAPFVLVIDQTRDDASIQWGGASAATFREMLVFAQEENPGARIVIKTHPETALGLRPGHFGPEHTGDNITLLTDPVSPWRLLDHAIAVYTVSSQLGYEAILAGHKPRVFGQPFYAGWGLTQDESPVPRRERRLTRAQIFTVSHLLAPTWYDPARDRLCSFEEAVDQLEAETRALREDRLGHVAVGMRLWKRAHLQKTFGREKRLIFEDRPTRAAERARAEGRGVLVWAGKETPELTAAAQGLNLARVEDGFLRSRGLGADLVPPLSLVADTGGIYYDPARPSDLESLIAAPLPPGGEARAERLIARLIRAGLSKYNLGSGLPDLGSLPEGHRILVPGQVEDDASILKGAGPVRSNAELLALVRAENPGAVILYKPHPDVEAGLRAGALAETGALAHADRVIRGADPVALVGMVDEVWTMTSLLGFEALIRGCPVTCLGTPFYAGWGLTRDIGPQPARRQARPSLAALVHAALIAYPRYLDPVSGLPCPPEVVVERLEKGEVPRAGPFNRSLSKLQGLFASHARLWR